MNIRTRGSKQYVDGDVFVGPTFTTGYQRDLEVARRLIRQRKGDAKVGLEQAPERDRGFLKAG